jgi:crotonobetainyl-CoA:carnitine CoA-transferase CaiB-like acyl-CoA transferase
MVLSDMGADVIKIESGDGDATRRWGPPFIGDTAVYFLAANRNKRSVVLDLTDDRDREIARALAGAADVVIENFRPGKAADFGVSYDDLRAINPGCVYCSITGFGSATARENEAAYDLVVQAEGGMMGVTGLDGQPPVKVGVATADLMAGLYASTAILAAIMERTRTGTGHHIEIGLLDTQVAALANQALNWLAAGLNPPRLGSHHPNVAPYGAFPTSTGHLVIAVGTDRQFVALAQAVEHSEWLQDERFASNAARVAHRSLLAAKLESVLVLRRRDEWLDVMRAHGVPCAAVRDVAEVFANPDINERMVATIEDSELGAVPQVRSPVRFDGAPSPNLVAPPTLGEHTEPIVAHVLQALGGPGCMSGEGSRS